MTTMTGMRFTLTNTAAWFGALVLVPTVVSIAAPHASPKVLLLAVGATCIAVAVVTGFMQFWAPSDD